MKALQGCCTILLIVAFTACAQRPTEPPKAATAPALGYDPAVLPSGSMGALIRYGHDIIIDTPKKMKGYVVADMSCEACHLKAGTVKYGGQFAGIAATFPQYNQRAHRVITLQDRIAECFLYSMNGKPPAYYSREMEAMVAYVTWLSRGTPIGVHLDKTYEMPRLSQPARVDPSNGRRLYAQRCVACHQASGTGVSGEFPPLWGDKSFNRLAGMHRLGTMAGFVKYNMPLTAPNSLSTQQAYDVSAFVLAHSRPKFRSDERVAFPGKKASYF